MSDKLRMTFVIPTFNRPKMLHDAVASCLNQTVPVEVIVVDHGSSEETRIACKDFDSSVTVVRRDLDSGPIFAWLDGVLHATTDFVNLNFDDDLKHPQFAEKCLELLNDDVGMVFSQARIIDASGTCTDTALFRNWFADTGVYRSDQFKRFFSRALVSPCAAVYRRDHMVDALYVGRLPNQKTFYQGVGPDLNLQLLAQLNYKSVGYVAEELAFFRAHPGSITIDASASGRTLEFTLAYDEVRLAILDLRLARLGRAFRIPRLFLYSFWGVSSARKRLRSIARRFVVMFRRLASKVLISRSGRH